MNSDSPNTADIVERLNGDWPHPDKATCREAAAIITELREALEVVERYFYQDGHSSPQILASEVIRKARTALKDHRKAQAHER